MRRLKQGPHILKAERRLALDAGLQRFDMHAQTFRPVRMLLHQGAQHLEHVWHGQAAEMCFPASAIRRSPEISLGRSVSRMAARVLASILLSATRELKSPKGRKKRCRNSAGGTGIIKLSRGSGGRRHEPW